MKGKVFFRFYTIFKEILKSFLLVSTNDNVNYFNAENIVNLANYTIKLKD